MSKEEINACIESYVTNGEFDHKAYADTAAYTVSYGCDALGMPMEVTLMLSLFIGCTVSIAGGKYLLKDTAGVVVKEIAPEDVEDVLQEVSLDTVELGGRQVVTQKQAEQYLKYLSMEDTGSLSKAQMAEILEVEKKIKSGDIDLDDIKTLTKDKEIKTDLDLESADLEHTAETYKEWLKENELKSIDERETYVEYLRRRKEERKREKPSVVENDEGDTYSGEEWYNYFVDTYGKENVQGTFFNEIKYEPTSGVNFTPTEGKTTTILGRYDMDTQYIFEETGNIKSLSYDGHEGGFNLLNVPDELSNVPGGDFGNDYNVPFLDEAIGRKDVFSLATEPNQASMYRIKKDTGLLELSGFGKEIKYLESKGYVFDKDLMQMVLDQ